MGGLMPAEPRGPEAQLLSAAAGDAGWAGLTGGLVPLAGMRPAAVHLPTTVPPALAGLLVAASDSLATTLAGALLQAVPLPFRLPSVALIGFVALAMPLLAAGLGAYAPGRLFGGRRASPPALAGLALTLFGMAGAATALGAGHAFRLELAGLWLALAAPLLLAGRAAASSGLRALSARVRQRAVLVGDGPQASRFAAAVAQQPNTGLRLIGQVDDGHGRGSVAAMMPGLPRLGDLNALCQLIRRGGVDQVILALPWTEETRVAAVMQVLADYPVDVRLAPDLLAYRCGGAAERLLLHRLADRPISGWAAVVKTAEDYLLAGCALLVAAVPMALIALAVRLDSPGPILFRQRRTGFNNNEFHVLKFRTMYVDQTDHRAERQVTAGDPRVTRVGAILRRTSLDELPQIFNVLKGEMSFIGPRPHAPGTRAGGRPFEQVVARYAARHRVKPGLTGLAQVRGWRGPTETEEKLIRRVESDLEYIETWSPWLDFTILVRTLLAVVRMKNAL
ncbi:exopolysaccharide biosynthesis polyprenyl glycosylphosphotransferase [Siccirubricoccus sp. KC 17139]|uniref:Exopolysaccharide biosynthesis polyprenyl glycosylphosphotransferase n=1 Tax=Siccirubricoccus soli TaxID=2899147 RepID=A0ABT1DAD4_9PROT|nr:exopolysaccharide biosynthesis polyprenyl glycosylphosphotransferase [Siccirubricoccus soli]MCO6418903.1 exopolysaccharide biosynthesis polyprenyl glycosylphosphotransferase [Siccirubricoccus soli]MCP2685038.1 exopolysaccharide biosynthesis polyprenyl glycosylphosphotransferase [Siccirubricoccus soli]